VANRSANLTNPPVEAVVEAIGATPGFFGWRVVAAAFTVAVFGWAPASMAHPSISRSCANREAGRSRSSQAP
jgi:hypothetical protein